MSFVTGVVLSVCHVLVLSAPGASAIVTGMVWPVPSGSSGFRAKIHGFQVKLNVTHTHPYADSVHHMLQMLTGYNTQEDMNISRTLKTNAQKITAFSL